VLKYIIKNKLTISALIYLHKIFTLYSKSCACEKI